jgi:hypothetical protein
VGRPGREKLIMENHRQLEPSELHMARRWSYKLKETGAFIPAQMIFYF